MLDIHTLNIPWSPSAHPTERYPYEVVLNERYQLCDNDHTLLLAISRLRNDDDGARTSLSIEHRV